MKKEGKAGVEQKGPKAQAERRAAADAADHDHYHSPSAHSTAHLAHRTSPLGGSRDPARSPALAAVAGSDTTAYRTASRDDNLSELDNLRLDGVTADQIENLADDVEINGFQKEAAGWPGVRGPPCGDDSRSSVLHVSRGRRRVRGMQAMQRRRPFFLFGCFSFCGRGVSESEVRKS